MGLRADLCYIGEHNYFFWVYRGYIYSQKCGHKPTYNILQLGGLGGLTLYVALYPTEPYKTMVSGGV